MKLDKILKNLVKSRGITVSLLSKRTKVPVQTLHNWLSGMEPRSLRQVRKVADFFDVTIDYICFGIEPSKVDSLQDYSDEINAGVFEVVLRRVKSEK